jgi:hypothetical protein
VAVRMRSGSAYTFRRDCTDPLRATIRTSRTPREVAGSLPFWRVILLNGETGLSIDDCVRYLEAFDLAGAGTDLGAIYNSFIACLAPMEACQLLSTTFTKPGRMRQILVREVQRHMRQDVQPYHYDLLACLEQGVSHLPPNNRRSAAYVLLRLAESIGATAKVTYCRVCACLKAQLCAAKSTAELSSYRRLSA